MNGTYGKGCMFNCTAKCPNGEFCDRIDGSCPEGPMERRFNFIINSCEPTFQNKNISYI